MSLACSDLTPECSGHASPQVGTCSIETNLVWDFYPSQAWLWPWAVAVDHTSMSGRLVQGMLCSGVMGKGAKMAPSRILLTTPSFHSGN